MTRSHGQSLVEFALVAPVLIVLAMAAWDGGGALRDQLILNQAARDGARVAAMGYAGSASPSATDVCSAVTQSAADIKGLSCSSSNITYSAASVTVHLTYLHALFTPVLRQLWAGGQGELPIGASATFYMPQQTPVPATVEPSTPTPTPVPTAQATCPFVMQLTISLSSKTGYYVTFHTTATLNLLSGWQTNSSSTEVHLYSGTPLGGTSGRSSSTPPKDDLPGSTSNNDGIASAFTTTAVTAGTYTVYFYNGDRNSIPAGTWVWLFCG